MRSACIADRARAPTRPSSKAARDFGKILAENGVRLVYGGGSIGLMGAVAGSVIEHGGAATGIIPEFLTAKERPRRLAQEQIITRDMHERKRTMFDRADAFVALPGGLGTLEELVEQMTWAQLGRHKKPILIANINGFWDPLLVLIDHMRTLGLVPAPAAASISSSPIASRTSCRSCARRRARSPKRRSKWRCRRSGCVSSRRSTRLDLSAMTGRRIAAGHLPHERHRLDAVAVRIADERRVISSVVMRPQPRFAVGRAAGLERRGVEGIDRADIGRAQADMHAAVVGDALQGIAHG
jgi:uncharacterized protein (TIGR00730 family)